MSKSREFRLKIQKGEDDHHDFVLRRKLQAEKEEKQLIKEQYEELLNAGLRDNNPEQRTPVRSKKQAVPRGNK